MNHKYADLIVSKEDTILSVIQMMDQSKRKLMIVMDQSRVTSLISIGDIQRAIIKGTDLKSPIIQILRQDVKYATTEDNIQVVKENMKARRNEFMPVVTSEGELANVIFWEDLFEEKHSHVARNEIALPVIIMAGGKGVRLKPLTNVLPKPLIPLRDKTIIEEIMDQFTDCGCRDFFLSVNYKAELIRYYFDTLQNSDYRINYFQEDTPLGTAGSLHLLRGQIHSTFFVTNCDILVEQDFSEILNYHRENKNEITMVAALKNYAIPYGTLTTREDGLLSTIHEKPDILFKINTGLYILEPGVIDDIPRNRFCNITDLIAQLQQKGRRIGVFPVSEGSWTDIGNWNDYLAHISISNKT
jgi:dTDP-glucose pyrophosphorylase